MSGNFDLDQMWRVGRYGGHYHVGPMQYFVTVD